MGSDGHTKKGDGKTMGEGGHICKLGVGGTGVVGDGIGSTSS
jgi:hypothetical protein